MKTQILILVVVFLVSCGPASKLKRAKKLIAKAESQGAIWTSDTVYKAVEIPVPEIRIDTLIKQVNFSDTITIVKDKVVTKIRVDSALKTIYVRTEAKPDTIRIKIPVRVENTIEAKSWLKWFHLIGIGFALGIVAVILLRR